MSMSWFNPFQLIDTISNTVFGGLNYSENKKTNERNYQLQKETLEYQKQLQQKIFDREDTAIQRKKADLIAAGFNPLLAAGGSGAGAGSIVPVITPQQNPDLYPDGIGQGISQSINNMIQNQKTGAEIDKIKADESFMKANEEKIKEETKSIEENFFNIKLDADLKRAELILKNLQYDISLEALKSATIGNQINELSLNDKTRLEQLAEQTGMPGSLITPQMGFAILLTQTIGNATGDIFNAVAPIMQKMPIIGAIWDSVSDNDKIQALNSVLALAGAVLGINFGKLYMKDGKVHKGETVTNKRVKVESDGSIISETITNKYP